MSSISGQARLFDSLPDAYASLDQQFRYTLVNRSYEALLGVPRERLLGTTLWATFPSLVGIAYEQHVRSGLASGTPSTVSVESEMGRLELTATADGEDGIILRAAKAVSPLPGAKTIGEIGCTLRCAVDSTTDLIWSVDPVHFGLLEWNRSFEGYCREWSGISVGRGMRPEDFFPAAAKDFAQRWNDLYARALKEGTVREEYVAFAKTRVLDLTLSRVEADGKLLALAVFGKDITARRDAERQRQDAAAQHREIFEAAMEGIFRTRPDGSRLLAANPAFATILGYSSPDELLAVSADLKDQIWVDPVERSRVQSIIDRAGAAKRHECQFLRKDGSTVWVSLNARLVRDSNGTPLFYEGFIEEITERKRTREELLRSESRFRAIFERAPVGIAIVDSATRKFVQANPEYCRITGRTSEELRQTDFATITHPDDAAEDLENLRRLNAGEIREYNRTKRYLRPDGSAVWARLTVVRLAEEDGPTSFHMTLAEDVTERIRAERALEDSEERFRTLFENASVGIYRTTPDGRIDLANPALVRMLGYDSFAELAQRNLEESGFEAAYPRSEFRRRLEERGEIQGLEAIWTRKDRSGIHVRENARRVTDDSGAVRFYEGTVEDITVRKRVEQSLRESVAKFRAIFRNGPDALYLATLEEGRIIDANDAFERLFGYTRGEMIGKTSLELGLYADPAQRARLVEELKSRGRVLEFETAGRTKSGEEFACSLSIVAFLLHGEPHIAGAIRNITERKHAEQCLRASEQRFRVLFDSAPVSQWEADLSAVRGFLDSLTAAGVVDLQDHFQGNPDDLRWCIEQARMLDVNSATITLFEATSKGQVLEGWPRLLTEDSIRAFGEGLLQAYLGETPFRSEITFRTFLGKQLRCHVEGIVAPGAELSWSVVLLSVVDLTARIQAEESLRESEEKFVTMFRGSPVPLTLMEFSGANRFLEVNDAFESLFGYSREEAVGRTPSELGLWVDLASRDEALQEFEEKGCLRNFEWEFRRKNGEIGTGLLFFDPLIAGGKRLVMVASTDISIQKRAQTELQAEKALSDAVINGLPGVFYMFDRQGRLIRWNDEYAGVLGVTSEQAAKLRASDRIPEGERDRVAAAIRNAFADGYGSFEAGWLTKNGHRTYHFAGRRLLRGKESYMVGVGYDVTERRRAEQALRDSELKYRRLYESTSDAMGSSDMSGRIVECNPAFQALVGYTGEELQQLTYQELTPERWRALDARIVQEQVLPTGHSEVYTKEYRRKDGTVIPVELRIFLLRDEAGPPEGMWALVRDITERRKAEEALRASERRLSLAISATADAIWHWNPQTGETYYSPRWYTMLGYADQQFAMSFDTWKQLCHPADFEAAMGKIQITLNQPDGAGYAVEFRMRRQDGEWAWVLSRGNVVERDTAGHPVLLSGTHSDITAYKKLQEQFLQAQKMETVGRLAGGVAHDFNNLLTVINGYAEVLLGTTNPRDPVRTPLERILKAGKQAAGLTRQLLAFSRRETLQPRVLSLDPVLRDMGPMLERLMGEDIQIELALGADGANVLADPHHLEQVVMNLAVNARDAMPNGGRLLLETSLVTLDEGQAASHPGARAGRHILLKVTDTGLGMDEATRIRAFEPFFTTKGPGEGTGLGLSLVHGIVQQTGGWITLDSKPGQGATFAIYLPAATGPAAPDEGPGAAPIPTGSANVLVVEDQPDVLTYVSGTLERLGYRVLAAASAQEALSIWQREGEGIGLVLTDVVMPGMNGRELADRLAELRPNLKILFMSGHTGDMAARHGLSGRGVDYIQKPFSVDDLARKVHDILAAPDGPPGSPNRQ